MQIKDETLLREFNGWRCEWCGLGRRTEPHHLWRRGMGGGSRLDIRINLCSLCRLCHNDHQDGDRAMRDSLLELVARREDTTPEAIRSEIHRLLRLPKETVL